MTKLLDETPAYVRNSVASAVVDRATNTRRKSTVATELNDDDSTGYTMGKQFDDDHDDRDHDRDPDSGRGERHDKPLTSLRQELCMPALLIFFFFFTTLALKKKNLES